MPLSISEIRAAANTFAVRKSQTLTEARTKKQRTAFLCHSHADQQLVLGIRNLLETSGWDVYVDWADVDMPTIPNATTAARIKLFIEAHDFFFFLATPNSMKSRWCPWEIGYADGKKQLDRIIVIPTTDPAGSTHGSEYMQLYRHLDRSSRNILAVWEPGATNGTQLINL
jgi:hypothetical protein